MKVLSGHLGMESRIDAKSVGFEPVRPLVSLVMFIG